MNIVVYEDETLEKAIDKALNDLTLREDEILYRSEEVKGGLFKKPSVKVSVVTLNDIANYLKDYLKHILTLMNLDVTFETKIRDKQIMIKMYSNNNPILIGKNGKTLSSLQQILNQVVKKEVGVCPYILLDVENYKEQQEKFIERLARKTAKEVLRSKIDVSLDNMNAYERRIVHNALTDFKNIETISEGEDPNRHVIIKYKENE